MEKGRAPNLLPVGRERNLFARVIAVLFPPSAVPRPHRFHSGLLVGLLLGATSASVGPTPATAQANDGREGVTEAAQGRDDREPLLVLAASSLAELLPEIGSAWRAEGGRPVRLSLAATSRLAPQAARGSGADVFLSADQAWMEWLDERDGLAGPARDLFENTLVVVVPVDGGPSLSSPAELVEEVGRLALAGESVPAGRYAREALEALGVWASLEGRVVRAGSVRGALEWVAREEVDAAVVYGTDARSEPRVRVALSLEGPLFPTATYPGAVLVGAAHPEDAAAFLDFLSGDVAQGISSGLGFIPVSGSVEVGVVGPRAGIGPASQGEPALPSTGSAVRLSIMVGLLAVVVGLVPAVAVGWVLARRSFRGKALVTTFVLAPLVMPPVVTGFLLLALFGRGGPLAGVLDAFGFGVPFTFAAPVLAAIVVGFPLYVVVVRGAFEAVDPRYEEVSWTLGVPPRRTFFSVSIPLALPGIAAGAVLAFARALGEFGATVVLAGNIEGRTRTIALAVYTLLESPGGEDRMWLLVGASVAISLAALFGYEALSRRQRRQVEDRRGH